MHIKPAANVYFISGLSGAGKSTALRAYEDINYFVVDGLPINMASEMVELVRKPSMDHFKGLAFGMDTRQTNFLEEYNFTIEKLTKSQIVPRLIFLEADTETLLHRYAYTRRPHPMEKNGIGLEEALKRERTYLEPLRRHAEKIIDSSNFSIHDLRRAILKQCNGTAISELRINLMSFGYKYGIPPDSEMVFDLRFLPNPYFIEELRALDGTDERIAEYLFSDAATCIFRDKLFELLKLALENMEKEGRYRAGIAFGCTGGRHRSVAFTEYFAKKLRQRDYPVIVEHKHINQDTY